MFYISVVYIKEENNCDVIAAKNECNLNPSLILEDAKLPMRARSPITANISSGEIDTNEEALDFASVSICYVINWFYFLRLFCIIFILSIVNLFIILYHPISDSVTSKALCNYMEAKTFHYQQ